MAFLKLCFQPQKQRNHKSSATVFHKYRNCCKSPDKLETVLAFFATFVLESALVKEIMRWDMGVLRESPWYEEILKEGEARGESRGEVQGIILSIRTSLEAKFGNEGLKLMPQISQINDLEQLQGILRSVVLAHNFEELQQIFS